MQRQTQRRHPRIGTRRARSDDRVASVLTVAPSRAAQRRRPGRPTLLDSGKRETLLAAIRAGNRPSVAARFAGVSPQTLSEWMRRGRGLDVRPASAPYVELVADIEQAQAQAEVYALAMVRKAMSTNWRAAVWYLENVSPEWRRMKERPAPEASTLVANPIGNVIYISGEDLQRLATERIRAARGQAEVDDETLARRARLVSDTP